MPGSASTTACAAGDSGSASSSTRAPTPRGLADVPEIGEEPVGDVDHRMRDAAQQRTELGARIREPETPDQVLAMLRRQLGIASAQQIAARERHRRSCRRPRRDRPAWAPLRRISAARRDLADRGQRQDGGTVGARPNRRPAGRSRSGADPRPGPRQSGRASPARARPEALSSGGNGAAAPPSRRDPTG